MRETPSVIPDRIEPVVAYRYWRVPINGYLISSGWDYVEWKPLTHITATHIPNRYLSQNGLPDPDSSVIHGLDNCNSSSFKCGIHGLKYFRNCYNPEGDEIFKGQVYLWGLIVEHEIGYRSEFDYSKCL